MTVIYRTKLLQPYQFLGPIKEQEMGYFKGKIGIFNSRKEH